MVRSILSSPVVVSLKHATRNVWWRYKGRAIVNPTISPGVSSVLFVCLGNICRSPFAAEIASRRAEALGGRLRFSSAGIRAKQAEKPPEEANRAAAAYGISLDGHRPSALTPELVDAHDLIVVMEPEQRDVVRAQYRDVDNRVFLLSFFDEGSSGPERYVIADPFGMPSFAYDHCYRRIDRAVAALLSAVGPGPVAPVLPARHSPVELPAAVSQSST